MLWIQHPDLIYMYYKNREFFPDQPVFNYCTYEFTHFECDLSLPLRYVSVQDLAFLFESRRKSHLVGLLLGRSENHRASMGTTIHLWHTHTKSNIIGKSMEHLVYLSIYIHLLLTLWHFARVNTCMRNLIVPRAWNSTSWGYLVSAGIKLDVVFYSLGWLRCPSQPPITGARQLARQG